MLRWILLPSSPRRLALGHRRQSGERARGDTVDEHRTDHEGCSLDADERPARAIPDVQEPDLRALLDGAKAPFDVHSLRDPADVAKSNCRRDAVDGHLGQPPRGPPDGPEWA